MQTLAVELRTQKIQWVLDFIDFNGIHLLTQQLSAINATDQMRKTETDYLIQTDIIKCFSALLNHEAGIKKCLSYPEALHTIITAWYDSVARTKTSIMMLLSVLCQHSEEAFKLILSAVTHCKTLKHEDIRFERFVSSLHDIPDVDYKVCCCTSTQSTTKLFLFF